MTDVVIYVLIGLVAGILSGFFGLGGGLVIIPALIFIAGFCQHTAQGTSLAIMLPPAGLLAFLEYYKNGYVDLKAGAIICVTLFIGAFLGAKIAQGVSPDILRKGFAVLLIAASVKLLIGK